ncbi:LytR/AlgR family response regulator transcription factor [Longitalea arenae]|uniref:LytR/AlgR family response regulator transcription factor n=1 Tax=Longitalea arenae TaxID=2812558 RepID=UPI001967FC69|nr:LytTR family DNA-binding domain-containing protein [Longitalea arenae]
MINAIIIDDEPYCCESLTTLLHRYCPQVNIADTCFSGASALQAIKVKEPQLVFLDIEMPQMNGFELLQKLPEIKFQLVFTTSYDQYAIKAIRFSALDYLLKPIDRDELQRAVQKAIQHVQQPLPQQFEILLQKMKAPAMTIQKMALPTVEGLQMIAVDSILSCCSNSNYTTLLTKDKQKIIASRTLKEIEEMLEEYSFLRVHHSFLVNLNEVDKYIKGEGGYLTMSDGSTVPVSRSRKELLLKKLQPHKH